MSADAQVCPECGAPRARRAAGCARCGAIFDSGVAPTPAPSQPGPGSAQAPREPVAPAARGRGCGACALLATIVAVLTAAAGVALYVLARREFKPLVGQFERMEAESQLQGLAEKIEAFADRHDGRLPEDLFELSQERLRPQGLEGPISRPGEVEPAPQSLDLIDPWGGRIAYRRDSERGPARLTSLGADGQTGGMGPDADLEVLVPAR